MGNSFELISIILIFACCFVVREKKNLKYTFEKHEFLIMVLHHFLVSFLIFKCQLICTYSAVLPAVFAYAFAGSAMMSVLCAFLFNPSISTAHLARKWAGPFNPGFPAFLVCLLSCASFHS